MPRNRFPARVPSLLLTVAALTGCAGTDGPEDTAAQATLAIEGVSVVDVEAGAVVGDRTVLIRDDRIVAVGAASELMAAPGVPVVEGAGRFLVPGLWDMHVHVTYDPGTLPLYLAHGVTGVRDMGGPGDSVLAIRDRIRAGTSRGPWIVAAGPFVDGPKPEIPYRLTVRSAEEGAAAVDSVLALGADFVKIHNGLSPDAFDGIARRSREVGVAFVGHAPPSVGLAEAVAQGQRSVEHTTAILEAALPRESFASFDALEPAARDFLERAGDGVFADMATGDVWVTPTVIAGLAAARRLDPAHEPAPEEAWVTEGLRSFWELSPVPREIPPEVVEGRARVAELGLDLVRALDDADVRLLAGSDVGLPTVVPGSSLHRELELLVEAGMEPSAALRSATLEPSRFFGATDTLGTVASGKRADLVLLEANPLEDISNIRSVDAVIVRGQLLDQAALDSMLQPPPARGPEGAPADPPPPLG